MIMRTCIAEQRKEQRELVAGEVSLILEAGGSLEFLGRLLDVSQHGFRASHTNTALSTGQRVRFRHSRRGGHALVMWNRILPQHIESGFLILGE
jgi:hypothetical protein